MADKVIKHSDIIEDNVFQPTIEQGKELLSVINQLEKGIKTTLSSTQKAIQKTPTNAKEVEDLSKNIDKVNQSEKALLETERARLKLQASIRVERQNLNKELTVEAKLASQTTAAFEKSRIELKKLNDQLLNLKAGTKEFNEVAKKAGKLKDEINDAKDAVKAFANESKGTTIKTLFGQVFDDIKNLDFKGASDKAKILSDVIKGLSFTDVTSGIKDFGKTLVSLGQSILINPLFAIAAAITAVTLAIKEEYDAFKKGEEIFDKYNKQIKELAIDHEEAAKKVRDLKVANDELRGSITKGQSEEINARNKFTDKIIELKRKEKEKLAEIDREFAEASKATIAEQSLGIAGGGFALQRKRIELNAERVKKLRVQIEAETQKAIADETEIYKQEFTKGLIDDVNEEKKRAKEIKEVRSTLGEDLAKIQIKAIADSQARQDKEINDMIENEKLWQKAIKEASDFADEEGKKEEELNKKRLINQELAAIESTEKINKAIFEGLDERSDRQQKALNEEISRRDKAITDQQARAEAGLTNTLAFEQQKRDEAALALKESEEREAKRKEAQELGEVFLEFLKQYTKDGNKNAASKALADTLVAKGIKRAIAGFYEGTEDTGKAIDPLDNKGGRLAILHDNERVLTKKQNELIGDISNDELARLAYRSNLETQGREIKGGSDSVVINLLSNKLTSLEKAIKNKKEISISWDNYGARVEEVVENGMKTVYRKVTTGKKRI